MDKNVKCNLNNLTDSVQSIVQVTLLLQRGHLRRGAPGSRGISLPGPGASVDVCQPRVLGEDASCVDPVTEKAPLASF